MADTPWGADRPTDHPNVTIRQQAPADLRASRYGAGDGIYLDAAESRAAQAAAATLYRVHQDARERVARMAAAAREARAWSDAGTVIKQVQGVRHG